MCGLFGYYCFGKERPEKDVVAFGWKAQESRGRDAAGIAFNNVEEHSVEYFKRAVPVSTLLEEMPDDFWEVILRSPYLIGHARATTKGSAYNNENNHPVVAHRFLVTHNGVIANDDDLFEHFREVKRNAEVDSEAINLVLSQGKSLPDSISQLSSLGGSVSFAAIPLQNAESVLLGRMNGSSFSLSYDPVKKILYWASATEGLYYTEGLPVGPMDFAVRKLMPDETVFLLEPDKISEFGVTGQPFFRPKPASSALPAHYRNGGRPTGIYNGRGAWQEGPVEIPTTRETSLVVVGIAWGSQENYKDLGKPAPNWNMSTRVSVAPRWFPSPASVSAEIGKNFPTGYGVYRVCKDGLRFYTYKPTRKWWKKEAKALLAKFPPDPEVAQKYANFAELERVRLELSKGARQYGWMCPWCGVTGTFATWWDNHLKCAWCGIVSRPNTPSYTPEPSGGASQQMLIDTEDAPKDAVDAA